MLVATINYWGAGGILVPMDVTHTSLPGVLVLTPTPYRDDRGFFSRTFDAEVVASAGIDPHGFVQDSVSRSRQGVVRGLHVRTGAGEAKLVRCSRGAIFDVVVDLRPGSPTYLTWLSFDLDDETPRSVYIPAGCAHGFQALTEPADITYRIDREHDPSEDLTISFRDPRLDIPWPLPVTLASAKDLDAPLLEQLEGRLATIAPAPR